jgi:hypothetical protein
LRPTYMTAALPSRERTSTIFHFFFTYALSSCKILQDIHPVVW